MGDREPRRNSFLRRRALIVGVAAGALILFGVLIPDGFLPGQRGPSGDVFIPRVSAWTAWLMVGFLVVGLIVSVSIAATTTPGKRTVRRVPWWTSALAIIVAVLLATGSERASRFFDDARERFAELGDQLTGVSRHNDPPPVSDALGALLIIGIVLAVLGLLALGLVLFLPDRYGSEGAAPAAEGPDVEARAIDSALAVLTDVGDPRAAVIACYATLQDSLRSAGVRKRRSDTPYEFLKRALRQRPVSRPSLVRLTELFEIARFSEHVIDERMRDEAIANLNEIRSELGDT